MLLCAGTRWPEVHRAGVSGLCSNDVEQLIPSLPSMQLLLKIAVRKTQNITEWNLLFRPSTFPSFCNISSDSTEREILFNYTHIHFLTQIFRSCFWTALLVAGLHLMACEAGPTPTIWQALGQQSNHGIWAGRRQLPFSWQRDISLLLIPLAPLWAGTKCWLCLLNLEEYRGKTQLQHFSASTTSVSLTQIYSPPLQHHWTPINLVSGNFPAKLYNVCLSLFKDPALWLMQRDKFVLWSQMVPPLTQAVQTMLRNANF